MINGIEDFDVKLQKAILSYIASVCDMSENIEIEDVEDNIIKINDIELYVISYNDQNELLNNYNDTEFEDYFIGLTTRQFDYIDKEKWLEDYGTADFIDYLKDVLNYTVGDVSNYGGYYFYEIS